MHELVSQGTCLCGDVVRSKRNVDLQKVMSKTILQYECCSIERYTIPSFLVYNFPVSMSKQFSLSCTCESCYKDQIWNEIYYKIENINICKFISTCNLILESNYTYTIMNIMVQIILQAQGVIQIFSTDKCLSVFSKSNKNAGMFTQSSSRY